ncbi:C39 family peptidase [Lactobacillus sp. PV037]|uniref:C39 family peptidase n=1 Tax=Lactobacillus sp. PV037 TaxID=2594496 RepID=UPI002ACDF103|nr:C39 family peptidase [Lactobacillus sp. PV037]
MKLKYKLLAAAAITIGLNARNSQVILAATDNNIEKNSQTQANPTSQVSHWQTVNGKTYYVKNGKNLKGYRQIDGNWYVFNKKGEVCTGVHQIPHTKILGYFNNQGHRIFSNVTVGKVKYWINKKGTIVGVKNNAKVVSQLPEMPTGCEITAVTMMLNYAGVNVSKFKAAKIMHYSFNPNKGFIGSPYKKWPLGYWVAPDGVKSVVKHYLGTSKVMTRTSMAGIKNKLIRSHLVVAWVGNFDGFSNHAITLTGYIMVKLCITTILGLVLNVPLVKIHLCYIGKRMLKGH